jgi:hypothetical protein
MAINIRIGTAFDAQGINKAKREMDNLKSSINSLGKNFAVAGVAIAAAGSVIVKSAQSLARIETINAQTAAAIESMGNVSGISAKEIENLAGKLEGLTATEAETIQQGANLLLTFKNIKNEAGAGNDIFTQTTAVMVDLARAMGTDASSEAIRLGKALNDPIKGIASLTKVGVSFTNEQKEQIKALQDSGDLLGAQKIILAELQTQFGGSGAAYAKTFTGQLELMGHELGTIGEEATMAVMPALQGMVEELRELIPVIGPQLKTAIESVDWAALVQVVVDFTKFLIDNAAAIAQVGASIWAISTAYKTLAVIFGLIKVATTVATVVQLAYNKALTNNPIGLVVTGISILIAAIVLLISWLVEMYGGWDKLFKDIAILLANFVVGFRNAIANVGSFFASMFNSLGQLAKGALNGILGFIEGYINFLISGVNGLLNRINTLLRAGRTVGIDLQVPTIPELSIPRLAEGGIVMPQVGGVLANIAEGGQAEAVIPLDRFKDFGSKGGNTYNITVNGGVGSGATIGKSIVDAIKSYERTSGAVWQGA